MAADDLGRLSLPVGPRDHAQGPFTASVTLVEYGDYECPHCGRAYPIVKRVQKHFGKKLCFVFRNFPLTNSHPHAEHAAEAAESAATQGKFWEMHDAIYENQDNLGDANLAKLATGVGADGAQVTKDVKAHTYAPRVREDFSSGVRSGVNGTPTFFINGVRYDESWDADSLIAAIEAALAAAG